jgi:hypothetical protein
MGLRKWKATVMSNIQAGTMLVEESLLLPEALRLDSEPYAGSWKIVNGVDSARLDEDIRKSGWNCFFVGGQITVHVVGWRKKAMIRRAVKRLLAIVKSRWFNSAEVTSVASGFFLGVPYVAVSGHSRQIQESTPLEDAAGRKQAQKAAAWACR